MESTVHIANVLMLASTVVLIPKDVRQLGSTASEYSEFFFPIDSL